jgi:DNA-binding beta-propeller fold protein YncE
MPTRPQHRTRREFVGLAAVALAPAAVLQLTGPAPAAPTKEDKPPTGVAVLDNCDPIYKGKDAYGDNLSLFDAAGTLRKRITDLNVCEEIGTPHRVAVDPLRRRVWVAETVRGRLLAYDLDGERRVVVPGVKASAVAIDPTTGNAWVTLHESIGRGSVEVFDPDGRSVATHDFRGYDIAHDPKGNAFWLVEQQLLKVSLDGKVLVRKDIAEYCAVSVAVDPRTGGIWAVTCGYDDGTKGRNELLGFDPDGKPLVTRAMDKRPLRVSVDPKDGAVWVVNWRRELRWFTAEGKPGDTFKIPALTADVDRRTGHAWAVTESELLTVDRKGEVVARAKHKGKTTQAWIACY